MEYCSKEDCGDQVLFICRGSHELVGFCHDHFKEHQNVPGEHQIVDYFQVKVAKKDFYNVEGDDIENIENFLIFQIDGKGFLLALNVVDIYLPEDYKRTLDKISEEFVEDVCSLKTGSSEKLEEMMKLYVKALRNIIENIDINFSVLRDIVIGQYNLMHCEIESLISSGLIELLDQAEEYHQMKKKTRKKLVISLDLKTEKQRYIQKYITNEELDIDGMIKDFYKSFSHFLKGKDMSFANKFLEFETFFIEQKQKIKDKSTRNFVNLLSELHTNGNYMRVGLFTYKITTPDLKLVQTSNWKIIIALILQKSPCFLKSIHNLSNTELLINLFLINKSYIIYYSPIICSISLILYSTYFIISSGSTPKSIIISQPKHIKKYRLKQGKLEIIREIFLRIKPNEKITALAYINRLKKYVYVCDKKKLYCKVINAIHREKLNIKLETEELKSLKYCKENRIICLESTKCIRIFSCDMILLNVINVIGKNFAFIDNRINEGIILIFGDMKIIDIRLVSAIGKGQKGIYEENFKDFEVCKYSKVRDLLEEAKSNYKYFVNEDEIFSVPDMCDGFIEKLVDRLEKTKPVDIRIFFDKLFNKLQKIGGLKNEGSNNTSSNNLHMNIQTMPNLYKQNIQYEIDPLFPITNNPPISNYSQIPSNLNQNCIKINLDEQTLSNLTKEISSNSSIGNIINQEEKPLQPIEITSLYQSLKPSENVFPDKSFFYCDSFPNSDKSFDSSINEKDIKGEVNPSIPLPNENYSPSFYSFSKKPDEKMIPSPPELLQRPLNIIMPTISEQNLYENPQSLYKTEKILEPPPLEILEIPCNLKFSSQAQPFPYKFIPPPPPIISYICNPPRLAQPIEDHKYKVEEISPKAYKESNFASLPLPEGFDQNSSKTNSSVSMFNTLNTEFTTPIITPITGELLIDYRKSSDNEKSSEIVGLNHDIQGNLPIEKSEKKNSLQYTC
ncbi:hypothetical protein SteCoe_4592 [Stentor coeruleus]|uniref:Uncharacterized protein n=1 Tax=Stentor coeruleus TaxID=5963 RepID=A0A1R2CUE1_9CILI|nr:hypothetical protein SteCoe_4592 [Stentor coeruleus]